MQPTGYHIRVGKWLLAAVAAVACAGCEPDGGQGRFQRDARTLIIGRTNDAITLDPGRAADSESVEVNEQIYDKLLRYDPETDEIKPSLAESWEVSGDGTVWTFQLRQDVLFHDGTPLTAEAVVFSFERQRDPDHPFHDIDGETQRFTYWASTYQNIRKVSAIGPFSVRIVIDRPFAPFAENLTLFPVAIVSPSAVSQRRARFSRDPVGTGPYRFREWISGERIVLERNPDYWGPAPYMKHLVFQAIADAHQRLVALESGAIDVAYQVPPETLDFVALHPSLEVHEAPVPNVAYMAMNTATEPWSDLRVRQAINHAIDRTPIVKLGYRGQAIPAHGPLPPGHWGHHEATTRYPHDPARARALLAEAAADGAFDPKRPITLYAPSAPRPYLTDPELVVDIIKTQLEAIGLEVAVKVQPVAAHFASVRRGEHDLCLMGWVADTQDPDNILYTLLSPENAVFGVARNLSFFRDPVLGDLLEKARATERPARDVLYARAQERVAEMAPWVPLAHARITVATRRNLDNVVISPNGIIEHHGVRRRE